MSSDKVSSAPVENTFTILQTGEPHVQVRHEAKISVDDVIHPTA
jgi:hypothetical protein